MVRSYLDRNGVQVKKLLVVAATIAGVLLYRKVQESEARKTIWSESTDTVD
ncbi:DLW-39 family protein [Pseudarthrobacter albicanus]|uniref:DLW-39 family protein n=1 Tax=Pseudarthrobacter TaxID=1742993 RepID=UPI001FEA8F65